jgi:membrane protein
MPAAIKFVGTLYGILAVVLVAVLLSAVATLLAKILDNKYIFMILVMALFASLVNVAGLQLVMFLLAPFVVSVMIKTGIDKKKVAIATISSILLGVMTTTYASTNLNAAYSMLNITNYNTNVVYKFIVLLLGLVILAYNLVETNKKVKEKVVVKEENKKDNVKEAKLTKETKVTKKTSKTTKSSKKTTKKTTKKNPNKADLIDQDVIMLKAENVKQSLIPLAVILGLLAVLTVIAFMPWNTVFGVKYFEVLVKDISSYSIFGFKLFSKLLGGIVEFGGWSLNNLNILIFFTVLLIAFIYKVKLDDLIDGFIDGVSKAVVPALLTGLVYLIVVINALHPFQAYIYNALLGLNKGFSLIITSLIAALGSVLNGDITYTFYSILPQITLKAADIKLNPLIALTVQMIYGLVMFVAPTSVVLLYGLSKFEINYTDWIKSVWKIVLELLVLVLIILVLVSLI